MKFKVWYMKPAHFRDGIFGKLPDAANLEATHTFLRDVEADGLDAVFYLCQAEVWSPNGEACMLIESKGLGHTSMSTGDVIETEDGVRFMVSPVGFEEVK